MTHTNKSDKLDDSNPHTQKLGMDELDKIIEELLWGVKPNIEKQLIAKQAIATHYEKKLVEARIDELQMALTEAKSDGFPTDMLNVCSWIVKRLTILDPKFKESLKDSTPAQSQGIGNG